MSKEECFVTAKTRLCVGLVFVLIVVFASQPVAAYYVCAKSDSTNYNYLDENTASHYTNEDVNTDNGVMKAKGENGYWDGLYTVFEEVGMDFDAEEAGTVKVAAEWQANYHIWTDGILFRGGIASIRVQYILYSPSHELLESQSVFYREAIWDGEDSISGTDSRDTTTWYYFTTYLTQGWSYTLAVRLTFSMWSDCNIEGVTANTPASVDVDYICVWNYPDNP